MKGLYIRLGMVLGLLLFASAVIWLTDADLRIARSFYLSGYMFEGIVRWPGWRVNPWAFIYDFAHIPEMILSGSALLILLGSLFIRYLKIYRRSALFIVLLLAIGPGLIINVLFKEHYGRARPEELMEFGGKYHYTQIWERGKAGKNSSFPSGHAAMGFYMMAPWFLLRRRKPAQAISWLVGGIGFGLLVGLARMLQGAHFLSDVLWAGGFVYITGEILYAFLFSGEEAAGNIQPTPIRGRKRSVEETAQWAEMRGRIVS